MVAEKILIMSLVRLYVALIIGTIAPRLLSLGGIWAIVAVIVLLLWSGSMLLLALDMKRRLDQLRDKTR